MEEGQITHHVRTATAKDSEVVARIIATSFTVPGKDALDAFQQRGSSSYRVLETNQKCVGAAMLHLMGQYFGGRRVTCLGVGALAVAPEARGQGAAAAMRDALLREGRREGYALSALYPSTQPLYRAGGYEHGARWTRIRVPIELIPRGDSHAVVEEIAPGDRLETLKALYFAQARNIDGHLDRSDAIWHRMLHPPDKEPHVYLVTTDGAPCGYVVLCNRRTHGFSFDIEVLDLVVTSRAALSAVYRLLAGYASLATAVELVCGPTDPFVLGLTEQRIEVTSDCRMMLRILDLEQALTQRQWPRGLKTTLELQLSDPVFEEHQGRWVIAFEGGKAHVRQGGSGTVQLDVGALAALYGATADPAALAWCNRLKGPAHEIERIREVFAAPMASCRDFF